MLASRWILPSALLLAGFGYLPVVRADSAATASTGRPAAKTTAAHPKTDRAALTELLVSSSGSPGVATSSTSVSELRKLRTAVRYENQLIERQDAMLKKIWELGASTAVESRHKPARSRNVREENVSPSQTARGKSTAHAKAAAGGRTSASARLEARLQSVLSERVATLQHNQTRIELSIAQISVSNPGNDVVSKLTTQFAAQAGKLNAEVGQVMASQQISGSSTGRPPATASR